MSTSRRMHWVALIALTTGALSLPKVAIASAFPSSSPPSSRTLVSQNTVPSQRVAASVVVPTQVIYPPGYPSTTEGTYSPPVSRPVVPPAPVTPPARPPAPLFPITPASNAAVNYRVVVAAQSPSEQRQVKTLVPQAFPTNVNGQSVMQVGVFREQSKANQLYQLLTSNNLRASILTIPAIEVKPVESPVSPAQPVPNSKVIVVIDPGHGGRDPGAVGIGGLQEKNAVFSISQQVVSFLAQQGIQAVLTRSDDREVDLEPRVAFADRARGDLFVSIHANAISMSRPDINGLETYYYSGGNGRQLAQTIHNAILQDTDMRDRGVRTANFYVIKYTDMPAVLVETGFVTGREDAARLSSAAGRTQLAKAIARGIAQYVRARF